mmetsp:Transcript_74058/g.203915  ORF Transcript_74058/g.203915 Transcript_74058/m.203915 type:complete len:316 (-) Transcript_74058:314-1261(-)
MPAGLVLLPPRCSLLSSSAIPCAKALHSTCTPASVSLLKLRSRLSRCTCDECSASIINCRWTSHTPRLESRSALTPSGFSLSFAIAAATGAGGFSFASSSSSESSSFALTSLTLTLFIFGVTSGKPSLEGSGLASTLIGCGSGTDTAGVEYMRGALAAWPAGFGPSSLAAFACTQEGESPRGGAWGERGVGCGREREARGARVRALVGAPLSARVGGRRRRCARLVPRRRVACATTSACRASMQLWIAFLTKPQPCLRIASERGEPRDLDSNSTSRSSSSVALTSASRMLPLHDSTRPPSASRSSPSHFIFISNS